MRRRPRWAVPALVTGVIVTLVAGTGGMILSARHTGPADGLPGTNPSLTGQARAAPTAVGMASTKPNASPTARPSPTSRGSQPPRTYTNWPGPSNTGVPSGTTLRKVNGDLKITKSGTVINGIDLRGCISLAASNVTIKRSRLRGSCAEGTIGPFYGANYTNILIEDVEIDGMNQSTSYSLVGGRSFTCRRCNLHGGGTGIRAGSNVVVEDSYLHDNHVGGESHNTAMSIHGGSNITIRHNHLQCDGGWNCSSALSLYTADGAIDHVLVEENLFSGGGYCVYGGVYNRDGKIIAATHVQFLRNGFLTNQWPKCGDLGPVAGWEAPAEGNVWSGNYWYPNRSNLVEA